MNFKLEFNKKNIILKEEEASREDSNEFVIKIQLKGNRKGGGSLQRGL